MMGINGKARALQPATGEPEQKDILKTSAGQHDPRQCGSFSNLTDEIGKSEMEPMRDPLGTAS
ncbi:MAG TPA: hypothetical protein VIR79_01735, partial [Nitrospira sp.]